jgi:DNA-binding response OmpR family regulator
MSKPVALVHYTNLLPGSQVANRLIDLGYRVETLHDLSKLRETAEREKPLVVIAEISQDASACAAITELRNNAATSHIPVLAFSANYTAALQRQTQEAGVTLLASSTVVLDQFPRLLDQALEIPN